MKSDLPNVFANPINKKIRNTQELFYGNSAREIKESNLDINTKINRIFMAKDYIYKKRCLITTDKYSENKIIIGRTNNALLTMNNEKILIKDIKDISPL